VQSRGIHHLDLVVSDVARSKSFYSTLLRGLGWGAVLELEGERGEEIWYLQAAETWLGLREKQSEAHPVPYDRYAVGVHHIAFEASTRDAVDECWEWILTQDVETESAPKEFPALRRGLLRRVFL
jgi:glyoxylase I family protein